MTAPKSLRLKENPNQKYQIQSLPKSLKLKQPEKGILENIYENISEIPSQGSQGGLIGGAGTYGDILDLFGLQAKKITPGEELKYSNEFPILEKMERGEVPSYGEMMLLGDSEEVAPRFSRIASSKELSDLGKELGFVSEPKTPAGRYAKRTVELVGSTVAFGDLNLAAPILAGITGQTLEEAGAPAWLQAFGEIIAFIKASPRAGERIISSKSPEIETLLKELEKAGYSAKDLTLAKNALEERKILKPWAKLTKDAEKSIDQSIKKSEQLLKDQIGKGLPGYEKGGLNYLEDTANKVYQSMVDVSKSVPIKNSKPLKKSLEKSIAYLEKYPLSREQKQTVEFLKDALAKSSNAQNADFYTEFFRTLNKEGKWLTPSQKEHIFRETKNAIKETFAKNGPVAAKFGEYFEKTNQAWKKWKDTKSLMEKLEKAQKTDRIDWGYINRLYGDPNDAKMLEKVLGKKSSDNIKAIAKGANAVESLKFQLTKSKDRSLLEGMKAFEFAKSIFRGDLKTASALIGIDFTQRAATQLLIDPKYQNILKNIANYANKNPKTALNFASLLMKEVSDSHVSKHKMKTNNPNDRAK